MRSFSQSSNILEDYTVQRVCDGHIICEDVTRRGWWSTTVVLAAVVELIALLIQEEAVLRDGTCSSL